jgi:hypothetical protein
MFANKHLKNKTSWCIKSVPSDSSLEFFFNFRRQNFTFLYNYVRYSINKIGNKHTIKTQTNKDIYQRRQKPLNLNFQLFILQKKKNFQCTMTVALTDVCKKGLVAGN